MIASVLIPNETKVARVAQAQACQSVYFPALPSRDTAVWDHGAGDKFGRIGCIYRNHVAHSTQAGVKGGEQL